MPKIDYAIANRKFRTQKSQLTRALNRYKQGEISANQVKEVVTRHVREWDKAPFDGAWPDDWSRWQRALSDVGLYAVRVDDLR